MEETERNEKKDVTHNLVWHTMEISRKMREDHMKQMLISNLQKETATDLLAPTVQENLP